MKLMKISLVVYIYMFGWIRDDMSNTRQLSRKRVLSTTKMHTLWRINCRGQVNLWIAWIFVSYSGEALQFYRRRDKLWRTNYKVNTHNRRYGCVYESRSHQYPIEHVWPYILLRIYWLGMVLMPSSRWY